MPKAAPRTRISYFPASISKDNAQPVNFFCCSLLRCLSRSGNASLLRPGKQRWTMAIFSKRPTMKIILFCFSALLGFGWPYVYAADLANDEQKELYALGVAISQSLGDF